MITRRACGAHLFVARPPHSGVRRRVSCASSSSASAPPGRRHHPWSPRSAAGVSIIAVAGEYFPYRHSRLLTHGEASAVGLIVLRVFLPCGVIDPIWASIEVDAARAQAFRGGLLTSRWLDRI